MVLQNFSKFWSWNERKKLAETYLSHLLYTLPFFFIHSFAINSSMNDSVNIFYKYLKYTCILIKLFVTDWYE